MSIIFIVFTAIVTIVFGLSASADKYGTLGGKIISAISSLVMLGLIVSVFYNYGIKTGIIYTIMVSIVAVFFNEMMQPKF